MEWLENTAQRGRAQRNDYALSILLAHGIVKAIVTIHYGGSTFPPPFAGVHGRASPPPCSIPPREGLPR